MGGDGASKRRGGAPVQLGGRAACFPSRSSVPLAPPLGRSLREEEEVRFHGTWKPAGRRPALPGNCSAPPARLVSARSARKRCRRAAGSNGRGAGRTGIHRSTQARAPRRLARPPCRSFREGWGSFSLRLDGEAEEFVAVVAEVVGVVAAGGAGGDVAVEQGATLASSVHGGMGRRSRFSAGA